MKKYSLKYEVKVTMQVEIEADSGQEAIDKWEYDDFDSEEYEIHREILGYPKVAKETEII